MLCTLSRCVLHEHALKDVGSCAAQVSRPMFCTYAAFADRSDGPLFGKVVANQILRFFLDEYPGDLAMLGHNLRDFHGFHGKLSGAIRSSLRPILTRLQGHYSRAIFKVIHVTEDSMVSTGPEVDELATLANLQSLLQFASEMLAHRDDSCTQITIDGSTRSDLKTQIWRIDKSVLLVVVRKTVSADMYAGAIDETIHFLRILNQVLSNRELARAF